MTQEKHQLDKIIELYSSGIEENVELAIQTAINIFGISKLELDYMAFYRDEEPFQCRVNQEVHYDTGFGTPQKFGSAFFQTNIEIKSFKMLPLFLTKLFHLHE